MTDGSSTAGHAVPYRALTVEMGAGRRALLARLKTIPWSRVIVETLLLAGMLLASSRLLMP